MQDKKSKRSVMDYESVLPTGFNGTFTFSNPSDEDFVGVWAKEQYLFPAGTTVPLIMINQSPLEIQHIRKKFAKDLAEREFYKSKNYKVLSDQEGRPGSRNFNSIHQAATYTLQDLEPYIKKCLEPLPVSELLSKPISETPIEDKIHRKDDGSFSTEAIDKNTSLRKKALES